MIREAQSILEGHPPIIQRGPFALKPNLETISEVMSSMETGTEIISLHNFDGSFYEDSPLNENINRPLTSAHNGDEIPEIKEVIANETWEAMHKKTKELESLRCSPPFSIANHMSRNTLEVDNISLLEEIQTIDLGYNKLTLRTMPSYLGEYERCSETM